MTRYQPLWLQAGSYAASVDRRLLGALWPSPASTGCAVSPAVSPPMSVNVAAGQIAVPSQNNTGTSLCSSDAVEQVALNAAPGAGTSRIDLIICQPRGNDLDGGANNDFIFTNVTGTAAATPAVPATPAGSVALAQVLVPGQAASIVAGNITDVRPGALAIPAGANAIKASCRYTGGGTTSATGGTVTLFPFTSKAFDDANAYNTSTGVWTCPYAGVYQFLVQYGFNTAAGQGNRVIYKNGSQLILNGLTTSGTGFAEMQLSVIDRAVVGDQYDFRVSHSLASIAMRTAETFMAIAYIGP